VHGCGPGRFGAATRYRLSKDSIAVPGNHSAAACREQADRRGDLGIPRPGKRPLPSLTREYVESTGHRRAALRRTLDAVPSGRAVDAERMPWSRCGDRFPSALIF